MIYYKLDWYCVMLYDQSISFVLDKLKIDKDLIIDATFHSFGIHVGSSNLIALDFDGVRIQFDQFRALELLGENDNDPRSLLDEIFDFIRVEITGTGLTWLRSIGAEPDKNFALLDFWGSDPRMFNVKRVDFAFDFVNMQENFINDLILHFHQLTLSGKRAITGHTSGVKHSMNLSSHRKCCYLGSSQSDLMLRIYDKLMESKKNGVLKAPLPDAFLKNEPDGIVNCWTRFELQTRDEWCHKLLFQPHEVLNSLKRPDLDILPWSGCAGDFTYVLRFIVDRYSLLDFNKEVLPFIQDWISDFKDLPALVPIFYYAQSSKPVIERAHDFIFNTSFSSLFLLISVYGFDGLRSIFNDFIENMNSSPAPFYQFKKIACMKKIQTYLVESGNDFSDLKINVSPAGVISLLD